MVTAGMITTAELRAWTWRWGLWRAALMLALGCVSGSAAAINFDFANGLSGSLHFSASIGAALRMESRDPNRVGKLNLPGQYNFCEDKSVGVNCSDVAGNAQFLALPGVASVNNDNGNLNYDKHELIAAPIRFVPELKLRYGDWGLDLSAVAFYDVVNYKRKDRHPNNFSNNGFQPARTPQAAVVTQDMGADVRLKNAYVYGDVPLGDYLVTVKLGQQLLSWGEALTLVLNGISSINPPDAPLLTLPGSGMGEFLIPVPMLDLSSAITESLSVEVFYQLAWKRARPPPEGSFFSQTDSLSYGGDYATVAFGKYREDPQGMVGEQGRIQGAIALLTQSSRTLTRTPDRRPRDGGQYGLRLGYFAYWLNNTSFGLYFHNLHSRLPYASFIAADASCLSNATNQVDVLLLCQGFANVPGGKEPVPFDTAHFFRDYPEDIRTFGVSFSTNLGAVAWAGEIAYRPNQPLQISPTDLGFAAIQPFLPDKTISLVVADIPGKRVAAPDYVETRYRGHQVAPNMIINGYERFKTIQYDTSFVVLRGASDNPIGADRVTAVLELGAYQVLNMPSLSRLQLAAPGAYFHHSAGIDGTGMPNAEQAAVNPKSRLNPHYRANGFADSLSYGYRLLMNADYPDLLYGINISPQLAFFHDVSGIAPLPAGQFIEGRKQLKLGVKAVFNNQISSLIRYNWIWGGQEHNLLADRDYIQWSLSYEF